MLYVPEALWRHECRSVARADPHGREPRRLLDVPNARQLRITENWFTRGCTRYNAETSPVKPYQQVVAEVVQANPRLLWDHPLLILVR